MASEFAISVLADLVARRRVILPLAHLGDPINPGPVLSAVSELALEGRVVLWQEADEKPFVVTLTPLEASRHRLSMNDTSTLWLDREERRRLAKKRRDRGATCETDLDDDEPRLDERPDVRTMDPADQVAALEQLAPKKLRINKRQARVNAKAKAKARTPDYVPSLPFPRVILTGHSLWVWSEPEPGAFCPGCWGGPVREWVYCLRCTRWGLDHRLPPRPKKVAKRVGGAITKGLQGGRGGNKRQRPSALRGKERGAMTATP